MPIGASMHAPSSAEILGGTWSLDLRHWQLTWSRQTAEIHEAEPDFSITASRALELITPAARASLLSLAANCALNGTPFEIELDLTTLKNNRKRARITGVAVPDEFGRLRTLKGIVQELPGMGSERRRADEVTDLRLLAYALPHELRAPLATIRGFARLLEDNEAHALSDKGRHWLRRIAAAAGQMDVLAESLMKLAPVSSRPLAIEPVDLSELARDAIRAMQERDPGRTVDLFVQDGLRADGDRGLLAELLAILLSNSWKFTSSQRHGRISFKAAQRDGKTVFAVSDNGAGFDMREAANLFGIFCRLHPREEFEGSGIGLAIAKRIVERHGGAIWAAAEAGRGADFFFTLRDGAAGGR